MLHTKNVLTGYDLVILIYKTLALFDSLAEERQVTG